MDIAYLLWLQGIRESAPPAVESFFVAVSALATSNALVLIPCLLYWCVNKRSGQFVLFSFSLGTLLNQFVKNTVCCYRPWIRDAAVRPAKGALAEATGYSFPSGHTQGAASLFGALGWSGRRRWPALCVLCWAFVLLVGFSRNFLGVHTPQDVLVGLAEGVFVVWAAQALLAWADQDQAGGRDLRVLAVAMAAVVAYVAYVVLKPYPMDYDASGVVLVDPIAMQVDCFKSAGVFAGAFLGWCLERRLLSFEVDPKGQGVRRLLLRFAVGMAVVIVLHVAPRLLLAGADERVLELVKNFFTVFGAVFVAPAAFCAVERRLGAERG